MEGNWLEGTCKSGGARGDSSSPLRLRNFLGAFVFVAGGFALGVIALLCECLYFYRCRRTARDCNYRNCCSLLSNACVPYPYIIIIYKYYGL